MIHCRRVNREDANALARYLRQLSPQTKCYFAPHPFDMDTLASICKESYDGLQAFICLKDEVIVGYAVIKKGYSEGELYRFPGYAINMNPETDYLLAPSVADDFQSQGIGSIMLAFIETELEKISAEKMVLWGGVQLRNERAVRYYTKNGFKVLGEFHHEGLDNLDMVKYL